MLEKLQIRNVGTNEKLDVELGRGTTTIVGKSFIGKSWILRALRLVALNKPAGTSFISWGTDKAKVRLSIDDGKRIIRIRSKNTNIYRFGGKKKPYVAFGNDVPKDIAEILNLSEINFQGQHSAPFWFCETAGEVSRQLNSIVNLELIDSTLANIASELRTTTTVITITEKALGKAVQQKRELDYVKNLNRDLKNVEKLQKQYEEDTRKHSTIDEKVKICIKLRILRESSLEQVSDGLKVMSIGEMYQKTADSAERLSKLVKSARNLQNIIKARPPSILPLEKLRKRTEQTTGQYMRLDTLIKSVENRRQEKCQTEKILNKLKIELGEIAGGRCPLCGKSMVQKS